MPDKMGKLPAGRVPPRRAALYAAYFGPTRFPQGAKPSRLWDYK